MSARKYYIPSNDAEFNDFFQNLVLFVSEMCSGTPPTWPHIPEKALELLENTFTAWLPVYQATLKPHTSEETSLKNDVKAAATKVIRDFVNEYLRHSSYVTDDQRRNMRIPVRKKIKAPVERPDEAPGFTLKPKGNRLVEISFFKQGSKSRGKPYGYDGVVIHFALLDHPPKGVEELTRDDYATKSPKILEFTEPERGQRLYVVLCWENTKGKKGPLSDIQSTVVP